MMTMNMGANRTSAMTTRLDRSANFWVGAEVSHKVGPVTLEGHRLYAVWGYLRLHALVLFEGAYNDVRVAGGNLPVHLSRFQVDVNVNPKTHTRLQAYISVLLGQ